MQNIFKKIIITIMTIEAQLFLQIHKPVVIGVTGNVGKTSTKDAMYTIISKHRRTTKTPKSYNSDIGIPLSILELPNYWSNKIGWIKNVLQGFLKIFSRAKEVYVLEIGADHPGDISKPASWIKPKYSVFTRFPEVPVHIEFFDSKEQVILEKKSLAMYTQKDGVLILNADDPVVLQMKDEFPQKILTYGINSEATIQLLSFSVHKKNNHLFGHAEVMYQNKVYIVELPRIIAQTQILSALPGILVLIEEGVSVEDAFLGLNDITPTNGRLSVINGIRSSVLIDDTYNSSPSAVVNAIETLISLPERKRTIAVLGDMMELGTYTEEEHRKVGQFVADKVDVLITVGVRSKFTHEEALKHHVRDVRWFEDSIQAGGFMKEFIKDGDVVLFKGSQSPRLERALEPCVLDKNDIQKYLVRQDTEWLKR